MGIEVRRFRQGRHRFIRELREAARQHHIDVALSLRREIQRRNPLDRGRSSASWNLSSGRPRRRVQPRSYQNRSEGRFLDAVTDVGTHRLGRVLIIINALPYIRPLNRGHSQQAPPGWIDAIVLKFATRFGVRR